MMKLKLVKLEPKYRRHLEEMMVEWCDAGEKIVPYAIRKNDYRDFAYYLANLEIKEEIDGRVPDSTFFCLDEERDRMVGAVNIRHDLNEALLLNGGHIGDGVRPSERGKGIATQMIAMALDECRKLGIRKVLMVCDKENIASAKSIRRNGGILENEVLVDGVTEQRYWIELK
jgi:predicted acetyltransferase